MIETIANALDKVLAILSWKKLAMLAVLLLMCGVAGAYYETRAVVYQELHLTAGRVPQTEIPPPSKKTIENIQKLVIHSGPIVAAELVNFDWHNNERHPVYFYSDDRELQAAMLAYQADRISYPPLLITGDSANNDRLTTIMNGDYICVPIPARVTKAIPVVVGRAKAICSISVPPYKNFIVGYVNIWIDHMPTNEESIDLRAIVRSMSIDVYERDVNPVQRF